MVKKTKNYRIDKAGAATAAAGMCFIDKIAKNDVTLKSVQTPIDYYYVTLDEAEEYLSKPQHKRVPLKTWYAKLYPEESKGIQPKSLKQVSEEKLTQKSNEITPHNITDHSERFGFNLKKIENYAKKLPSNSQLPTVSESGGLFGVFNHKVTGEEINSLSKSVQNQLIASNRVLKNTISEFNTVYKTLDALDKEYIQGILISLKAAEEANGKALKGLEGVKKNTAEIQKDQGDISRLVEQHSELIERNDKIIQALKIFKIKIDKLEHVTDVDAMFRTLALTEKRISEFEKSHQDLALQMKTLENKIGQDFKANRMQLERNIQEQQEYIDGNNQVISEKIDKFDEKLTQKIETVKNNSDSKVSALQRKIEENDKTMKTIIRNLSDKSESEKRELGVQLLELKEITDKELLLTKESFEKMAKKMKITQFFAGITFVLLITVVILIVAGIL